MLASRSVIIVFFIVKIYCNMSLVVGDEPFLSYFVQSTQRFMTRTGNWARHVVYLYTIASESCNGYHNQGRVGTSPDLPVSLMQFFAHGNP